MTQGGALQVTASFEHDRAPRVERPPSVPPRVPRTIAGCGGGVRAGADVRLRRLRALEVGEPLLLRILPDDRAPASVAGAVTVQNPCLSGGVIEIVLEPRVPPPALRVVGETPAARALAGLAYEAGLAVAVGVDVASTDAGVVVALHRAEREQVQAAPQAGRPGDARVASRTRGDTLRTRLEPPDSSRAGLRRAVAVDAVCGVEIAGTRIEADGDTFRVCAGCRDRSAASRAGAR
jgi:xanthine dehydrogenase accessory factor